MNPWKSREDEDKESDWVLTLPPQKTLQDKCYLRCVELALMGNMNPLLLINIFFVYPGALTTSYLCEAAQSVVELDGPEMSVLKQCECEAAGCRTKPQFYQKLNKPNGN